MTADSATRPTRNWQKYSNIATVLTVGVAAVSTGISIHFYNKNVDLTARISSYTTMVESGNLVLEGRGGDFLLPDKVVVVPVWSPLDPGIGLDETVGEPQILFKGREDKTNHRVTYTDILERICKKGNEDRCNTAPPKYLRVSVHLLGKLRDTDEIPAL